MYDLRATFMIGRLKHLWLCGGESVELYRPAGVRSSNPLVFGRFLLQFVFAPLASVALVFLLVNEEKHPAG